MQQVIVAVAGALLFVTGCSHSDGGQKSEAERQEQLRDSSFGDLTATMERASEVEQLQQNRKAEIDAALEGR